MKIALQVITVFLFATGIYLIIDNSNYWMALGVVLLIWGNNMKDAK